MLTKRFRRRVERGERGAALVEFALIFPIFMTLVLGMFSGGRTYNHNLSVTHAAREGARYGSTLAKEPDGLSSSFWWSAVEDVVIDAAAGHLDLSKSGHWVCIALVDDDGITPLVDSLSGGYYQLLGNHPNAGSVPPGCYDDGLGGVNDSIRVHVAVGRPGTIDALFYTHRVNLESRATARYEAGS